MDSGDSIVIPTTIHDPTDDEIYDILQRRSTTVTSWDDNDKVRQLTDDAVVKMVPKDGTEVYMINHVSSRTTIRIPKIIRILPLRESWVGPEKQWVIMEYIKGGNDPFRYVWRNLSWCKRISIMWTIRGYIKQLHKVPIPNNDVPGPFGNSRKANICYSHYLTNKGEAGPFYSYLDMANWFNRRRFELLAFIHSYCGYVWPERYPKFDMSQPLVLCHMDLDMSHFILDTKGKVWMVGWGRAGAYPAWLEYAQMVKRIAYPNPKLWTFGARFMVGDYRRYKEKYLDILQWCWSRPATENYPNDYFLKLGISVD